MFVGLLLGAHVYAGVDHVHPPKGQRGRIQTLKSLSFPKKLYPSIAMTRSRRDGQQRGTRFSMRKPIFSLSKGGDFQQSLALTVLRFCEA